jgi:hypothetical protein
MTIRIYGDSYGAKTEIRLDCWADILGRKLLLPVVNKAVSGGSTEYAIKLLANDIREGNINDNDIVFFVTSLPGRLHFKFQHDGRPETAALYHNPQVQRRWIGPDVNRNHDWYYTNKKHIEWWIVNQDLTMASLNHEAYLHLIENYARTRPNVKFFILANMDHNFHIPIGEKSKNLFKPKIFLHTISKSEIIGDKKDYWDWVKYTTVDFRVNHLSNPNLEILTNCLVESIETESVDNITYDRFKSNFLTIIQNKQQYLEYVSNGWLYHYDRFLNFLS